MRTDRLGLFVVVMVCTALIPFLTEAALNVGDQAADFTLLSQFNTNYHLYDDWGKVILIDFSTIWCTYCRQEAPVLESDFYQVYKDRGLVVLTIITENNQGGNPDLADVQWWANQFGLTFPVLVAANRVGITYGIPAYPTNYIIDRNMVIRYKQAGWGGSVHDQMIAMIEALLDEGSPTPTPGGPTATPTVTPTPADATATPGPTTTPEPSPTPGIYDCEFQFAMPSAYFREGDTFSLTANLDNHGPGLTVDFYTVLDVLGSYYFYPSWTSNLEYERINLNASDTYALTVLAAFTWPRVEGSLSGLAFYGIVTYQDTLDLASNLAYTSFGYGP